MFPWRKYSKKELIDEFKKLKKYDKKCMKSLIGYKCSNNFFQKVRLKTPNVNNVNTFEMWKNPHIKKKVINYQTKLKKDKFGALVYITHPPSQFPIILAKYIYKLFNCTHVFDPYAGWGDRCLAAMASDIDYTGTDTNIKLKTPYRKMINLYKPYSNSKVNIIFKKAEDYIKTNNNPKFDLIFSSPPFWKKKHNKFVLQEKYNKCESNYYKFLNNSLITIIKYGQKNKIPVCMYINKKMYIDVSLKIGKCKKKINYNGRIGNQQYNADFIYIW